MARAADAPTVSSGEWKFENYRAPEWTSSPKSADARADIYSWGSIFFHLATGETYDESKKQVLIDSSALPSTTCPLILRCLERDPAQRPASINEVIELLKRVK